MGQPATGFAWCDYAEWVENPASREDWLYYAGRDGLAFLRDVPVQAGRHTRRCCSHRLCARDQVWPRLRCAQFRLDRSTLIILIVILCLAFSCCIVSPPPGRVGKASLWMEWRLPSGCALMILTPSPPCVKRPSSIVFRMRPRISLPSAPCWRLTPKDNSAPSITTIARLRRFRLKGPRLKKFYPAYRQLAELLREQARQVVHRLQPGELVLFDNTRILHGSTAGEGRHLQGCYVDADGLYSSLAVLSRTRSSHDDSIRR